MRLTLTKQVELSQAEQDLFSLVKVYGAISNLGENSHDFYMFNGKQSKLRHKVPKPLIESLLRKDVLLETKADHLIEYALNPSLKAA